MTFTEPTPPDEPLVVRSQIVRIKESGEIGSKATVQASMHSRDLGVSGAGGVRNRGGLQSSQAKARVAAQGGHASAVHCLLLFLCLGLEQIAACLI